VSDARARDAEARRLAQTCFDRPLLLEAGAGTGKTAVLVARIVAWSLGEGWERTARRLASAGSVAADHEIASETLRRVVAITFTEAAAAEMGNRVAAALLAICGGTLPMGVLDEALPPTPLRAARAEALVGVCDQLTARTIHAFCRRLLVAHPLEAGLPPELTVDADGQRQAEVAREVIEAHLPEAFADPPQPDDAALVDAGLGPGDLERALTDLLAEGAVPEDLGEDPLRGERVRPFGERLLEVLRAFAALERGRLAALGRRASRVAETAAVLARLAAAAEERPPLDAAALDALASQVREICTDEVRGKLREWAAGDLGPSVENALGGDALGLAPCAAALRAQLEAARQIDLALLSSARRVLAPLLASARARLRAEGVESFGGLLRRARELLAAHPEAAARARRRIDQLLVDEFQDTDATQCEILEALAFRSRGEGPALFLVGDPKQSIYGWRQADLRAYHASRRRVEAEGGQVLPLVVNHRSVAPILREVARIVAPVMEARDGLQPPFEDLRVGPGQEGLAGFGDGGRAPVEHWLSFDAAPGGGLDPKTKRGRSHELEARAVAGDLVELRAAGVPLDHVALLFRSTGDFDIYLGALREAEIPAVLAREPRRDACREVLDATALVRCILDVHDHLALVAALRSPWVGVPDAALLPLWVRGFPDRAARLDGRDPAPLEALRAAVAEAAAALPRGVPGLAALRGWESSLLVFLEELGALRRLHAEEPPDRFVEALRLRLLPEASEAGRSLGAHRLDNLERFFRDLLEALEEGAGSAAAVSARLRRAGSLEREHREGRARSLVPGAVQVMTIHRAKGLDFEHVYLLQTHKESGRDEERRTAVVRGGGRVEYVLFGAPTPGLFEVERDQEALEACERVRLLYVATTRARSRLVIAGTRPFGRPVDVAAARSHAALLAGRAETPRDLEARLAEAAACGTDRLVDEAGVLWRLPALAPEGEARPRRTRAAAPPSPERVRRDAARLAELRAAASERQSRRFAGTASEREAFGEARAHELAGELRTGKRLGGAALEAGRALHAWLEHADLAAPPEAWRVALGPALVGLGADAAERAREVAERFLAGPLAQRLAALGPHAIARELPVLLEPEEAPGEPVGFVSGAIDLLVEDPATGELTVIDYKTDALEDAGAAAERARVYAPQGQVYTRAVRRALSLPYTPRFELWFLAAGIVSGVTSDATAAWPHGR
jgi:ATP-dependent helicase/nuclease subunit A